MKLHRTGLLKYGFIAPALIVLIALNIFPLIYNICLSFTDARVTGGAGEGVGGRNYETVFTDPRFAEAIRTTAIFVVAAVSIELAAGFLLALAIQKPFRGKTAVLTILLVPMMLSPAVMGVYWNLILNGHYGVLNKMLAGVGLPGPPWLTHPNVKLISVLVIDVWMWTPFMMLIALAGLQSIPGYVYEAAEIDRASRWRVFRRITLPMCGPLLVLACLFRTTDAIKQFDVVMAITGPNDAATQTLSALLYQKLMSEGRLGLAAAYSVVVLVLVIALATVFIRYLDRLRSRGGQTQP